MKRLLDECRALEYLYPFAVGEKKWTDQQLGEWLPQMLFPLLRRAALRYQDEKFQTLMKKTPGARSGCASAVGQVRRSPLRLCVFAGKLLLLRT
jgi:hypothetical protein